MNYYEVGYGNSPAERWPYEPLAALELRELGPKGVRCSDPSELRVRLSMSSPHSEKGEWESALFRPPLPKTEGLGLVSLEPVGRHEWSTLMISQKLMEEVGEELTFKRTRECDTATSWRGRNVKAIALAQTKGCC